MDKKNKPGQILVTLLIALTIISLMIVANSDLVRNDSIETTQAANYIDYYAATESAFIQFMNGDKNSECTIYSSQSCSVTNLFDESRNLIIDEVYFDIQELRSFNFLELKKDSTFTVKLYDEFTSYTEDIQLVWTGDVAWEISLDYKDLNGNYQTKRSLYSPPQINSISVSALDNCLTFTEENANTVKFFISSCISLANQEQPLNLRLRPIILDANYNSTLLSLKGSNTLPLQVKSIKAISQFNDQLNENPSITLSAIVPLNTQLPPIMDYVLRSDSQLTK